MRHANVRGLLVMALLLGLCCTDIAWACTGVRLKSKDGAYVYGRTMEFGIDLKSNAIIIPRGFSLQGTAAQNRPGMAWKTKFAAVGLNAFGLDEIIDGTNEKGLAAGAFYMPGYADYQRTTAADDGRTLAPWEVVTWLLTRFATVDEARDALPEIRVAASAAPELNFTPPLHYVVHDAQGNSLVIEFLRGELSLVDNPVGVITNSPNFEWHLTNLRNYSSLRARNVAAASIDGLTIAPFGQGSGMFGMPGDFTPASRFVRAVALGANSLEGLTATDTVQQLLHVLDSFDIPRGTVEEVGQKTPTYEFTAWTSASDLKNHVFYYHTLNNRRVRRIELSQFDLDAKRIYHFRSPDVQDFEDLKPTGK